MAVVASLDVVLNAVTKKFDSGLQSAAGSLKSFALKAAAVAVAAKAMGVAMDVARSAVGSLTNALADIDRIGKVSDKLGIAERDLIALRQAAAEFSGFTSQQFDMSLQRMTRRIAEAAIGTGEAKGALMELGLSARQLNRVGPAEAFRMIADRMSQVNNKAAQLRIAFKLFDSEGAGLVSTLNAGSAGLDEVAKFMEKAGFAFTEGGVNAVEAANDAIGRLKIVGQGFINVVAIKLAPVIERMAKAFISALPTMERVVDILTRMVKFAGIAGTALVFLGESAGLGSVSETTSKPKPPGADILAIVQRQLEEEKTRKKEILEIEQRLKDKREEQIRQANRLRKALEPPLTAQQLFLQQVAQLNKLHREGGISLRERNRLLHLANQNLAKSESDAAKEAAGKRAEALEKELDKQIGPLEKRARKLQASIRSLAGGGRTDTAQFAGALERGGQEAFTAFQRARQERDISKEQQSLLERQVKELTKIVLELRRLKALLPAEL